MEGYSDYSFGAHLIILAMGYSEISLTESWRDSEKAFRVPLVQIRLLEQDDVIQDTNVKDNLSSFRQPSN